MRLRLLRLPLGSTCTLDIVTTHINSRVDTSVAVQAFLEIDWPTQITFPQIDSRKERIVIRVEVEGLVVIKQWF